MAQAWYSAIRRCRTCRRYPQANSTTGMCNRCLSELDIMAAGSELQELRDLMTLFPDSEVVEDGN